MISSTIRSTRLALVALLLATFAGIPGCAREDDAAGTEDGRLEIVATTGMIADIVARVAGEHAAVEALMGTGVDPHLYKPTRSDILALSRADVVFYNGLHLEGKMADVLADMAARKPTFALAERVIEGGYAPITDGAAADPHLWMDVSAWARATEEAATALAEIDPDHAPAYRENAAEFVETLNHLDEYVRRSIASVPESRRVLVTAHDAFSYFGRAYGIEVRGIQGISTSSEAGVRDVNELIDFIVDRGISAVFVETSVADKNVRALIEGARARGHEIEIGGSLFSDAMGEPGTWQGTYPGMIDHNATAIARALGGEAPEGGFRARTDAAPGDDAAEAEDPE